MTGQVRTELSSLEKELLSADSVQQQDLLADRLQEHWSEAAGEENLLSSLGGRIRQAQKDLNILGRSPAAQAKAAAAAEMEEDDTEAYSQRLAPEEMEAFKAYMKKHHKMELSNDDMPVMDTSNVDGPRVDPAHGDSDWAIQWRTDQAQRQMDDILDDNPYADIMPQDLSTSPLVNRKQAKSLPRELLSYNNVSLLQSFMTETGQIKSRVQTRLGARDQRKIARLVKRSRALGLVPYQGPFRVEQHGWIHDPTLEKKRPWEEELERRGLVIARKQTSTDGEP
jgi:small subunit ribosomal protein S18